VNCGIAHKSIITSMIHQNTMPLHFCQTYSLRSTTANPLRGKASKRSCEQWRAEEGSERGAGPWHPRQGGIQRVKLQKSKCYNY